MRWQLHVAKLAVMGRLPFGARLRAVKRRFLGYPPNRGNLKGTLRDLEEMVGELAGMGRSLKGATVLEIGSGWFPVIPVMLAAADAQRVYLSDLTPRIDRGTLAATLGFLRSEHKDLGVVKHASRLEDFPFVYLAPLDLRRVEDQSVDFIMSRAVLEHIQKDDLLTLFRSLRPKLKADGLMLHCVDHSDHLEHHDKRLTKVNFLTWSDRLHTLVNALTREGENRLRHSDYVGLLAECGYEVIKANACMHEPTRQIAKGLRLAPRFRDLTPDEIAVLRSVYVAGLREPRADFRD